VTQEGRSNQMSRPREKKRFLCPSTLYQDGSRISGASISHWQSLHVSMAPPIVKRPYSRGRRRLSPRPLGLRQGS
jgi:hypothetical protein